MIDREKYSTDKIAFLGLFVLSIVIASFIVSAKSAVKLTKPIELEYASLAVPVPQGWKGDEQWQYKDKDNAYSLTKWLRLSQRSISFIVQFKYLLGFSPQRQEEIFAEKANALEARIIDTYEIENGNLKINWAHLENEQAGSRIMYGIAKLPHQRFLTLEVHQDMSNKDLAGKIFIKIARGIELTENKLLADGAEIISELKTKGITDAIEKHLAIDASEYYQNFFLVEDLVGNPLGFTSTSLAKIGDAYEPDVQGTTSYRLPNRAQITRLQSDNHFDKLIWESENTGEIDGPGTTRLIFESGTMTTAATAASEEKKYELSDAAIPNTIFELFLPQILDRFEDRIIIDSILYDGRIIPTVITKSKTDKNMIELKLMDGSDFTQKYFVDDNVRITKAVLAKLELIRSTKEKILELFPHAQNFF